METSFYLSFSNKNSNNNLFTFSNSFRVKFDFEIPKKNLLSIFLNYGEIESFKIIDSIIYISYYNFLSSMKMYNEFNFNLLASYINLVIDSNSKDIEAIYDRYFFIIKFAENVIFDDKNNITSKNYLCNKIYKLPLFRDKGLGIRPNPNLIFSFFNKLPTFIFSIHLI